MESRQKKRREKRDRFIVRGAVKTLDANRRRFFSILGFGFTEPTTPSDQSAG